MKKEKTNKEGQEENETNTERTKCVKGKQKWPEKDNRVIKKR